MGRRSGNRIGEASWRRTEPGGAVGLRSRFSGSGQRVWTEGQVKINLSKSADRAIVVVEGRLDTVSAPDFGSQLQQWISDGETRFVLDLADLEYVSSAGLRTILVLAKEAKAQGGEVCCCRVQGLVKQVFDVSGFSSIIPVFDSLEGALKAK